MGSQTLESFMSLLISLRSPWHRARQWTIRSRCRYSSIATDNLSPKQCDPLRILFCGSDPFSIASLQPLARIQKQDHRLIEKIDVLCRKDKLVGRGLKEVREVPIKRAALELGLNVRQIDHFREVGEDVWGQLRYNLIVAVSFGLLIPGSLIRSAKYGGLNVHPSLLPDLPGAAPVQYSIIYSRSHTGVTVQTLHPTRFDQGQILAQTPLSGISILKDATAQDLIPDLAKHGSDMLVDVIRRRAFVPPLAPILHSEEQIAKITDGKGIQKAPKIKKDDLRIDWASMTAGDILRRLRASGQVWDEFVFEKIFGEKPKTRISYHGLQEAEVDSGVLEAIPYASRAPGLPFLLNPGQKQPRVGVLAKDGTAVQILQCTIAGGKSADAGLHKLSSGLIRQLDGGGSG